MARRALACLLSLAAIAACSHPAGLTRQQASAQFLPPAPAGESWRLVWKDEFDGSALDTTKWGFRPEGPRRDGWWVKKAVSVDGGGHLAISALKEDGRYLSGCIVTAGKFEHAFGYYETRVQFQRQPGHWSAFWLQCEGTSRLGNEGRDGMEIDVWEKPTLDDQIEHNLHWEGYGKEHKHAGQKTNVPGLSRGWHTAGMWWKRDEFVFFVDGRETWRTNAGGVSQVPEYLMLSNEIGTWAGDISTAKLPDAFLVDYVRVFDLMPAPISRAEADDRTRSPN
jgi:beta-glucanase (GH16 family)